jgi:hypothetical protein
VRVLAAGTLSLAGLWLFVATARAAGAAAVGHSPIELPGARQAALDAGLALAFLGYAAGVLLAHGRRIAVLPVGLLALGVQLGPLAAPVLLSSDAHTYAGYAQSSSPYTASPDWVSPSVYGPVWTAVSSPIARLLHTPEDGFRVLAAVCTLLLAWLASRLAEDPAAALAFVGWNPLLALHGAGGGHNDALMMAFVLAGLLLARSGRPELGGAAWALSVQVKWISGIFWLLWLVARVRRRERTGVLGFAVATAVVAAIAFAWWGPSWLEVFRTASSEGRRVSSVGLLGWLVDTGLRYRNALALVTLVSLLALAVMARAAWRRGRAGLGVAGSVVALVQARLNPWYGAWGVGLAAADGELAGRLLALATTAFLLRDVLPL